MPTVLSALLAALLLAFAPGVAPAQGTAAPEAATGRAPKPLVHATREMAVTANPHATRAAAGMLARGGSAADAAIAALAVLNVVEPQSSGIGGGAFALVHGPEGLAAWDARETAPAAATAALFVEDGAALSWTEARASGHSVGAPGLVRLMGELHARHGRLPWGELFAPAIRLAREGFTVSPRLAGLARKSTRLHSSHVSSGRMPASV